jgi:hypothetical protein
MDGEEAVMTESCEVYLTEKEASKLTKFSVFTLRNWRFYRSKGPAYLKIGRSIRYKLSDLTNFMDSKEARPLLDKINDKTPLRDVFTSRSSNALRNFSEMETIGDLRKIIEDPKELAPLLKAKNFGKKSQKEVFDFFGINKHDIKNKLSDPVIQGYINLLRRHGYEVIKKS